MLKNSAKVLLNAVLAGVFIGIAGTVCLSVKNPVTGALFFGFGLLSIVVFGFKLYTGAIGYLSVQGKNTFAYLWDLLLIWAGNFAGCYLVAFGVQNSRQLLNIIEKSAALCDVKLSDSPLSIFILAIFCGMLMFTAVECFKRENVAPVVKVVILFLCVSVFILSGFEHCIANMYYFSLASVWQCKTFIWLLIMTAGNSIGGMLLCGALRLREL